MQDLIDTPNPSRKAISGRASVTDAEPDNSKKTHILGWRYQELVKTKRRQPSRTDQSTVDAKLRCTSKNNLR